LLVFVPRDAAEFLDEIRVAVGLVEDVLDRIVVVFDTEYARRANQRRPRCCTRQLAQLEMAEQAIGVALRGEQPVTMR
jgi:hypothetical protein